MKRIIKININKILTETKKLKKSKQLLIITNNFKIYLEIT